MIVRRAAESAQADLVISRISLQEGRRQSVRAGEIHAGVLVHRLQTVFYSTGRQYATLEFRRVLRGRGKEFAVRTEVEVEQLLLMVRERADVTHAHDGVPADVMLHLETETLNTGNVSLRIGGDHIADAERDWPGVRANPGEVVEVNLWVDEQRRLADGGEGQFVTLYAVIAQAITATHDRLLVPEKVIGESERGAELHDPALDAAREEIFAVNHAIERIARSGDDASDKGTIFQGTSADR